MNQMVPVSVRRPGEQGVYNNRVSAVFARLPAGLDDPAARLARIREQMDGIKASKQAVAGDVLESYPHVPIVGTIRIVVAIFSYDGQLYFGVTGDRDHAPDVDVLTAGIEAGAADLLSCTAPLPPPQPIRSRDRNGRARTAGAAAPCSPTA